MAFTVASWATCTTEASGNCEVGTGKSYLSIASFLSAMGAGQMFQVFSGTYNESPSISAGTAGNYKNVIINSEIGPALRDWIREPENRR